MEKTEQKTTEKAAGKQVLCFLLSCLAVFVLHCKFEISGGGFPDSAFLNGLNKFYNTFSRPDFSDLFVLAAVCLMLKYVSGKDKKADFGTLVFSFVLAVILVTAISFAKLNSADFLFANSYQMLLSGVCIAGFWVIIYGGLRCVYHLFEKGTLEKREAGGKTFLEKHFSLIGFAVIFTGWLPWILMNYPGSGCPDSLLQLQQFLGDASWGAWHPPLSTCIMGSLFTLGRRLIDANFGFFLYCFMQTCVGAWVFSFSMKKLYDLGIPVKWCMAGIIFFACTPFWGTYAQWVEKDLFYAEIAVLQTICMMEILKKKQCGKRDAVFLAITGLGAVFLRNNGIHAVFPALLCLMAGLKRESLKRVAAVAVLTLILYESMFRIVYPALGIGGTSVAESLSVPFQQTARYVCEHADEVTEYEREVIDNTFGYDTMFGYDPVISDPIKNYYRGTDLGEYFKIWFRMFFKHPETYVSAFINQGYGYIAPVSQNIEAWIQEDYYYYPYMEELGLHHVFDINLAYVLAQIWNLSMVLPLVKYLCTPGMYTWIVAVLAMMLIKRRKYKGLILFVPSFMNILVCLASPLATAIRYELPTVASVPLLTGWTYFLINSSKENSPAEETYSL